MRIFKKIIIILLISSYSINTSANTRPDSFADLAEKLMPSVVNISTTQTIRTTTNNQFPFQFPPGSPFEDMFKEFQQPRERKASSLGSGFIIKKEGIVVTNNHVIANAEDIIVRIGDKEYKAEVLGSDPYADVAVLKIKNAKTDFTTVEFGDSDKARVGDWVVAIGNPFGLGGTVTSGIISARNRDINLTRYDDFIQTDASINQGNSGGPLFNLNGEVIGINTAIIAPGQAGSIGIGFAIPANAASNIIDQGYPIGAINLAGQTPIILVNDGPSMGGFIVPYTVPSAAFWKLGQAKPGDFLSFKEVSLEKSQDMRKSKTLIRLISLIRSWGFRFK